MSQTKITLSDTEAIIFQALQDAGAMPRQMLGKEIDIVIAGVTFKGYLMSCSSVGVYGSKFEFEISKQVSKKK